MYGKKIYLYLFLILGFLFLNFFSNFWGILPDEEFIDYDFYDEALVYGKIANSERDGVFNHGGFPGVCYDKKKEEGYDRREIFTHSMPSQKDVFLGNKPLEPDFYTYRSQPGGQVITYSLVNKILLLSPKDRIIVFKLINALFNTLVFSLFFLWLFRNYKRGVVFTVFVLVAFSSWITQFDSNIWWVGSSYLIPLFGLLLLFDSKQSKKRILAGLYLFFLLKCLLTGFEFITCVYLSIFIPIAYYFYLRESSVKQFFIFSTKAAIVAALAILTVVLLIIYQNQTITGDFVSGFNEFIEAFTRRTSEGEALGIWAALKKVAYLYLFNSTSRISFLPFNIPFGVTVGLVFISSFILYKTKSVKENQRQYKALAVATILSFIPSISWFVIFRQHAVEHPYIDGICWFFPFLLFGAVCFGVVVSLAIEQFKHRKTLK